MRVNRYERVKPPSGTNDRRFTGTGVPMFDSARFPPPGTMCADCGCCKAGIYAGEGELRVAICIACDEGVLCAPQKASEESQKTAVPFSPADKCWCQPFDVPPHPQCPMHGTPATQPVAPAAGPAPAKEQAMPEYLCLGGCGETSTKPGFKWGHKGGCKKAKGGKKQLPPPSTSLAIVEPVIEINAPAEPEVMLTLTTSQLSRIFFALPIEEQGLAIQSALSAERE